jgi:hypothetical protein
MTTDQDNKRVSDAYRELARESTPEALDDRILAMAARESRSRYGLARAWVRPVAWAATIALSLAFVLEMTKFADAPQQTPPPRQDVSEERVRQDAEVMKAKQEQGLNRSIAERADAPTVALPASLDEAAGSSARAEAPERATAKASPLRRTETLATPAIAAPDDVREPICDEAARTGADSWFACILELREQGLHDAAAAELEALLQAFPDFREPPPE